MAQLLSYASPLHSSLRHAGWLRKFVLLPVLFVGIGTLELTLRLLSYRHRVVEGRRIDAALDEIALWYRSRELEIHAAYALLFLATFLMWIVLSVRIVTNPRHLSPSARDAQYRHHLRRARFVLVFALIVTVLGMTIPMSTRGQIYMSRMLSTPM
jgi:hypothetical protein